MTPQRIQLSRKRGYRKPEGVVVVSRPSKWGNPWQAKQHARYSDLWVGDDFIGQSSDPTWARRRAVEMYDGFLRGSARRMAEVRSELAGKDLACWCPLVDADGNPIPCHADVLLRLANEVLP